MATGKKSAVLIAVGILLISGCISQERRTQSQYEEEGSIEPTPPYEEENTQVQQTAAPEEGKVNDLEKDPATGMDFLPFNLCPEKIIPENNILVAIKDGKRMFVRGESEQWIRKNCDPGIWKLGEPEEQKAESKGSWLPSCGFNKEFFSASPIGPADITGIRPLGNLAPSGHTYPTRHAYFFIRKGGGGYEGAPVEVQVVSPGDLYITEIAASDHTSENPPYTDYSISFSPCKDFKGYFGHMTSISQKLKDSLAPSYDSKEEYTTGGKQHRNYRKQVNISVKAGEKIGTAGGRVGQNALDFGTIDYRTFPLAYANPSRWYKEILHAVCPIDYFVPDVRKDLENKLGDGAGTRRSIQPICGEVEQDEPGTAQGVWFPKGTKETYPEDRGLSLVHDNIDPSKAAFSVGTSSNIPSGLYYFRPENAGTINRDFRDVKADGKIYCFEPRDRFNDSPLSFVIILQMTSNTTLRVERKDQTGCGRTSWEFGPSAADFER